MVTTIDVKKFIESTSYSRLLNSAASVLKLNVNDENPPSQMFNIEANSINAANISLDELERICSGNINDIVKYIHIKLLNIKDDNNDEYNDGDDKDDLIEKLPFYKTFLIGYVIEYTLLKFYPERLDVYLKALRIPKYKKYSFELRDIYNKI